MLRLNIIRDPVVTKEVKSGEFKDNLDRVILDLSSVNINQNVEINLPLNTELKLSLNYSETDKESPDPETWKSLEPFEFRAYDISSYGRVRNNKTLKIIKPSIRESGYHRSAIINSHGDRSNINVHKYVALSFIGPSPGDEYTVDHIDRDPHNNFYKNLRWATKEQQTNNKSAKQKGHGRRVNQYDLDGNFIKTWNTAQEAGDALGFGSTIRNIPAVCKGKRNNTCGFIWKYTDQVNTIENEMWKLLPYNEYESTYISNFGRVKSHAGKILNGQNKEGYLYASIKTLISRKIKSFPIHCLVMETYVGPANGMQVNHKDGNKINNRLDNLEYVTGSENMLHAHATGLVNQYCRPVIGIVTATGEELKYLSIKAAAASINKCENYVRNRCTGKSKSNGKDGIYWKFADER